VVVRRHKQWYLLNSSPGNLSHDKNNKKGKASGQYFGGIVKLRLLAFFVTFASSSVFATLLAGAGFTNISSRDLGVLRKDATLALRYNPTIQTLTHPKRTATIRPAKWGVVSSQFGSPSMLNGVANKGIGAAATRSMPSMWQISNQVAFNTWLQYHPSPNSACQDDGYASFGANSTNEVSCDRRLQSRI
jgi:hypothetical protein